MPRLLEALSPACAERRDRSRSALPYGLRTVFLANRRGRRVCGHRHHRRFRFSSLWDNATALYALHFHSRSGQNQQVTIEVEIHAAATSTPGPLGAVGRSHHLAQWLPVLAFYDDKGWQPTPFHSLASAVLSTRRDAIYRPPSRCRLAQKLACPGRPSGKETSATAGSASRRAMCVRDFALIASSRFVELSARRAMSASAASPCRSTPTVRQMRSVIVSEAIPLYASWFGPYPYRDFSIGRVVLRVERQRVRRTGHDRRADLRHAAPAKNSSISSSPTRSATSGGTTSSAPTATRKPGWTKGSPSISAIASWTEIWQQ